MAYRADPIRENTGFQSQKTLVQIQVGPLAERTSIQSKGSQMISSVELITPEKATFMLAASKNANRSLSKRLVERYAYDMKNGKWKENGESLIFNCDGSILDGQHRLHAVVKSGVSVKFIVAKNINQDAFDTIDSGKKRTPGDILGIKGFKCQNELAASLIIVDGFYRFGYEAFSESGKSTYNHMGLSTSKTKSVRPVAETILVYCDLPESLGAIRAKKQTVVLRPMSFCASMHYILGKINSSDRDLFFEMLSSMDYQGEGCPVKALASAYSSPTISYRMRHSARLRAAYWFKCWNAFRENKQIKTLMWSPERHEFPMPV